MLQPFWLVMLALWNVPSNTLELYAFEMCHKFFPCFYCLFPC